MVIHTQSKWKWVLKFKNWIALVPTEPRKACPRKSEEPLSRPPFSRGHALRGALLRSNPE